MRTVGVGLLWLCPLLVGCSLFQNKRNDSTTRGGSGASGERPFQGLPPARAPEKAERTPAISDQELNSILAGYVYDRFKKPMSNAWVQVIDLQEPEQKGKIDIEVNREGEFYIPRLKPGHTYKLIARVNDGSRLLAGYRQATPPNPVIPIEVREDLVGPDTPPLPAPRTLPGKKPSAPENETKPTRAAELGTPIRTIPEGPIGTDPRGVDPGNGGTGSAPPVTLPRAPADPSRIADGVGGGDFRRIPPKVDVPGPGDSRPIPPPPSRTTPDGDEAYRRPVDAPSPKTETGPAPRGDTFPIRPTPVPSCLVVGKKLENFALLDLDGKTWEYRKEKKGKLLLLHFWPSADAQFLPGLEDLRGLQAQFGLDGLQVVGIAYQPGDFDQQATQVRWARSRYGVNYVTLLGGQGSCPVREQFQIDRLPELVLIAEDGQIFWRSRGAPDADRLAELKLVIAKELRRAAP